jgi:hypothetical protein
LSLLRDIQSAASNGEAPIGDLLMKAKILAARLGHPPLGEWVDNEIRGWIGVPDEGVPEYRHRPLLLMGNFVGAFLQWKHVRIHLDYLPAPLARRLEKPVVLREPITNLADLGTKAPGSQAAIQLPSGIVHLVGSNRYPGTQCIDAWWNLPISICAGIAIEVRRRVLDFALEIEAVEPNAGDAAPGEWFIPPAHVQHVFTNCVLNTTQMSSSHIAGNVATGFAVRQRSE